MRTDLASDLVKKASLKCITDSNVLHAQAVEPMEKQFVAAESNRCSTGQSEETHKWQAWRKFVVPLIQQF